jgi:hypothetical protein
MKEIIKVLRKVKLIEKHLIDLKDMWYDVTFNTPASIRNQIDENKKYLSK